MAFTEKYVTNAGAGTADGSSLANAWSWATMLTSLAAGQRANVQGAITRTTANDVFTNAGTASNPIALRGINTTAGDLDATVRAAGQALTTTNFAVVTYTTGGITLPTHCITGAGLVFTSGVAGTAVTGGSVTDIRGCVINNTHGSSGSARSFFAGPSGSTFLTDCDLTNNSSASTAYMCGGNSFPLRLVRCLLIGGGATGAKLGASSGAAQHYIGCMFRDASSGFINTGTSSEFSFVGCSFRNVAGTLMTVVNGSLVVSTMISNVIWGTGSTVVLSNTSGVLHNSLDHNAIGNCGADTNPGNWPHSNQVSLSADPFTSSTDMTLNSTSGGGAACKAAGTWGMDIGAWQSAGGGGSTGTPAFASVG